MPDKYEKLNENGKLRGTLLGISILVNAGVPLKSVLKHYKIGKKEYYELKAKYKDFEEATEKDNIMGLLFCIDNIVSMAEGYSMKKSGKEGYKGKDGDSRFKVVDLNVPMGKSLEANAYLLEKGYGKFWSKDYQKLVLAELKLSGSNDWEDVPDEFDDDGNIGD